MFLRIRQIFKAGVFLLAPLTAAAQCDLVAKPIVNVTTPGSTRYCAGDKLQFEFCATNLGRTASSAARTRWSNMLLPGCFSSTRWVSPTSADTSCTTATNVCRKNFSMLPNQTECIVFEGTLVTPIPNPPIQCGIDSILNFGSPDDPCGEFVLFFDAGCGPPGQPDTRLFLTMENHTVDAQCSSGDVTEGSRIDWLIEANNTGTGDEQNLVITDVLPAGLVNFKLVEPACTPCAPACAACYDPSTRQLTVNAGTLARNTSYKVRYQTDVNVTCPPPATRVIRNQARVTSDFIKQSVPGGERFSDNRDGDGFSPEDTCTGPIPATGAPSIEVRKTADRTSVAPNQRVRYTITFDARASACAVTGYIDDQSPSGLVVDPASAVVPPAWTPIDIRGQGQGTNGTGFVKVWNISLAPGTMDRIEYEVVADPAAVCDPPAVNSVTYTMDAGSGTASAPPVAFTGALPDRIRVDKTVDKPNPVKDDFVTYTITVTNLGSCALTGGVIDDPIPAGLVFTPTDVTIPPGPTNASDPMRFRVTGVNLGPTGSPTESITVSFRARVDGSRTGPIDNVATVTFATTNGSDNALIDVGSVCVSATPPVEQLKAVRQVADVYLKWGAVTTLNATSFNVWKVTDPVAPIADKRLIPQAKTPGLPPQIVASSCTPVTVTDSFCTDPGAVPALPNLVFYQIRGVCQTLEGE